MQPPFAHPWLVRVGPLLLGALLLFMAALAGVAPPRQREGAGTSVSELSRHIARRKALGLKTGALEADLWWYQQRAYPYNRIRWSALRNAELHRDRMSVAPLDRPRALATGRWEFIGPRQLRGPQRTYFGESAISGRVNGVAFSPTSTTTFYLAAAGGGVWKTPDSGQNWTPLSDTWTNTRVSCVAATRGLDNKDVLFVGTGDFNRSIRTAFGFGVMRSLNGGATWQQLGLAQFGGQSIRRIIIDPDDANIVTLTTGRSPVGSGAVWRTANALAATPTWTVVIADAADWSDLEIGLLRGDGSRLYFAAGHGTGGELRRSTDRGATWEDIPLPLPASHQEAVDIAMSAVQPNTLYFVCGTSRTVRKTTNAGAPVGDIGWEDLTPGFPSNAEDLNGDGSPEANYNWSQAGQGGGLSYDWHITCSRNPVLNVDQLYVGLIDLASMSAVHGWRRVGRSWSTNALTHNDQHCMAVNPANPDDLLVGNDGGVYRVTVTRYPTPRNPLWSWTSLNGPLGLTQFYHAAFHASDANEMLGGTQDNATPVAAANLQQWFGAGGGDGGFTARFDPSELQYATTQVTSAAAGGRQLWIARTQDRWGTWAWETPNIGADRCGFIYPIAAQNSNTLYAATDRLRKWNTVSDTWTILGGGTGQRLSASGFVTALAIAPSFNNRIYTGASNGEVWMTTDLGEPGTWTQIDIRGANAGTVPLPDTWVTSISVNPANPDDLLVAFSGAAVGIPRLWRCTNPTGAAGRTWTPVAGSGLEGLPDVSVNSISRNPGVPGTHWFAGTDVGVFVTSNGGARWENMTAPLGLPNVQVNLVQAVPGTGYLMAATFGRGMWRISIPTPRFRLRGRITLGGVGLANTLVRASRVNSSVPQLYFAQTDGAGNYAMGSVPAGSYVLEAFRTDHALTPSGFSNPLTLGPDRDGCDFIASVVPSAPGSLNAQVVNSTRIDLSWTDNSAIETNYEVERRTAVTVFASIATLAANTRTYSNTGLTPNTTYTYRVRCRQGTVYSGYSAQRSASTLAAPANLGSEALTSASVRVVWTDHSTRETGFELERIEGGGKFTKVAEVGAGVRSWTDRGVTAGKLYGWRVRGLHGDGVSDWCPDWPWIAVMPAPTELTISLPNPTTTRLTWADRSSNESGFRVERKIGAGSFVLIASTTANVRRFDDPGRAPGTRYAYRVRAFRSDGHSSYSNSAAMTTPR